MAGRRQREGQDGGGGAVVETAGVKPTLSFSPFTAGETKRRKRTFLKVTQ